MEADFVEKFDVCWCNCRMNVSSPIPGLLVGIPELRPKEMAQKCYGQKALKQQATCCRRTGSSSNGLLKVRTTLKSLL